MSNWTKSCALFTAAGLLISGCSTGSNSGSGATKANRSLASLGGKSGFQLAPYEEKTLANGLRVLYVRDTGLPYVSLSLLIKSGSAADPAAFPGLSQFVAEMLEKGTAKRSATEIADELGRIGADFSASVGNDYSLVTASSLSTHAQSLLSNFVEIATSPAFSAPEVERMRKQILAAIAKRVDSPEAFAETIWDDFLFENHPYGKPVLGTKRSIRGLRRKDLIQHYVRNWRPNNAIVAVIGKITPELTQKVETMLSAWEQRSIPPSTFPQFPPINQLALRLVDKPGLVQSQIRMGHKGIQRNNVDFMPLRVANTILGGAFASRLMDRVRKQLGLTYGISSNFDARLDFGPFEISTFTKNESTGQAISETLKVFQTFRQNGATEEEVSRTKGYLRGLFPAAIETPEKLAFNLQLLRLYGIPDAYLSNYLLDLERVSVADVNRVIRQYFDPQKIKVLVYSDAKAVLPQLQPLGMVEVKKASDY